MIWHGSPPFFSLHLNNFPPTVSPNRGGLYAKEKKMSPTKKTTGTQEYFESSMPEKLKGSPAFVDVWQDWVQHRIETKNSG